MNKIKTLATTLMLALGVTASAQKGWNTIYVQYNPGTVNIDYSDVSNEGFDAFSIGYNKAISLTSSTPLYLEVGAGLQYSFKSIDTDEGYGITEKDKYKMFSLKVPVSVLYDFHISNSKVNIAPFAGLTFRYNLSGSQKTEFDSDYRDLTDWEEMEESKNLFDEDDMGKDDVWKRFQVGYQIGVSARFNNKFMVSAAYNGDFSEIAKKVKVSQWNLTLGYCF